MYDADTRSALAVELADAFLAGPWRADLVTESGAARLDRWPDWIDALVLSVMAVYRTPPDDRPAQLVDHIEAFLARHAPRRPGSEPPRILRWPAIAEPDASEPVPNRPRLRHDWPTAELQSVASIAQRLELSDGQLAWLADVRSLERSVADEQLRNYRYRAQPRRDGLPRVIEAPKARLKEIQRWLLREILDRVPAHDAAHGFTRGRSAITHARLHVGQDVVLRLDLKDFFASISAARVFGIFRTLGYARPVAHVLTGISTNVIPQSIWAAIPKPDQPRLIAPQFWLGRQLATPHLPQGAPTSPALANLIAFRLDRRLAGLAAASGLQYSRYADDLTFSGSIALRRRRRHFEALVQGIVHEEGFALNPEKSALRCSCARQQVCGVVVNVHPNSARREYDRLKATLHNAAKHGPRSQNRSAAADFEAHLRGRISWVNALNPDRGAKLWARFEAIDWGQSEAAADDDD